VLLVSPCPSCWPLSPQNTQSDVGDSLSKASKAWRVSGHSQHFRLTSFLGRGKSIHSSLVPGSQASGRTREHTPCACLEGSPPSRRLSAWRAETGSPSLGDRRRRLSAPLPSRARTLSGHHASYSTFRKIGSYPESSSPIDRFGGSKAGSLYTVLVVSLSCDIEY